MTAPEQPDDGVPLCVSCAMCCDGTLFRRAQVYEGEEARIREAGLEIIDDAEKQFFRLPCHFNHCGSCQIYENRFQVCRTFFCALYKRHDEGEISLEEAKSTVRTALELRRKVVESEPNARLHLDRHILRNRLAEELSEADAADRKAIAGRMIDLIALDTYLDRHFRDPELQDGEPEANPNS